MEKNDANSASPTKIIVGLTTVFAGLHTMFEGISEQMVLTLPVQSESDTIPRKIVIKEEDNGKPKDEPRYITVEVEQGDITPTNRKGHGAKKQTASTVKEEVIKEVEVTEREVVDESLDGDFASETVRTEVSEMPAEATSFEAPTASTDEPDKPATVTTLTRDDLTKIVVAKIKQDRKNNTAIGEILSGYGYKAMSDLPPEKFEAFLGDVAKL